MQSKQETSLRSPPTAVAGPAQAMLKPPMLHTKVTTPFQTLLQDT